MNIQCYTPKEYKRLSITRNISSCATPIGAVQVECIDEAIMSAHFIEEHSKRTVVQPKLILVGTYFQIKVWKELLKIPQGTTISYQELAQKLGLPRGQRAVARAVASNRIAYFIPCHRVICSNGQLGGYRWGIERKCALLISEGINSFF